MIPHSSSQENNDAPNYPPYPPQANMMPVYDPNMQYWPPMPQQYPPGYQPMFFRPAGNSSNTNLNELLDLNDIFTDEFFPPDVNYNNFPYAPGTYDPNNNAGGGNEYADLFSARYEATQVRQPQSDYILKSKDNVILIPPSLPPNLPPMPGTQHYASSSSAPVKIEPTSSDLSDSDDSNSGDHQRKSSRRDQAGNKSSSKSKSGPAYKSGPIPTDPRDLTEYQKIERRERNREHAKRSRVRKKVLLDTLQDQLLGLRKENMALRRIVTERIPQAAARILQECTTEESSLLLNNNMSDNEDSATGPGAGATSSSAYRPSRLTSNIAAGMLASQQPNAASSNPTAAITAKLPYPTGFSAANKVKQQAKILMEPDYRLIQSLVTSQQNFVLSDPSLPDNPIVYASDGFCRMTGYKKSDVLGRNCRFLQGPGTDQAAVDIIRKGITEGRDVSVCLLNYKADGKPFWNQFFLAALKDADGQIVNYVGVQCEVNVIPVHEIKDRVKRLPIPSGL